MLAQRFMSVLLFSLGCSLALGNDSAQSDIPLNTTVGGDLPQEKVENRGDQERPNRWITGVSESKLTIFAPPKGVKITAAVVICPGGGYGGLAYDKEGVYVARWMADRGLVAGVLKYRVGGGANKHPAPRDDVQRAMQVMRSKAEELGYPADKVGVMGFSAGGHLAATAATSYAEQDGISSRPDFAILVYPVISMELTATHRGSHRNLLGENASKQLIDETSAEKQITQQTPPSLLIHAVDDAAVPVENSLRYMNACKQNRVPVEMHIYQTGGHGFGMWRDEDTISLWPEAMEHWLKARGLIQ